MNKILSIAFLLMILVCNTVFASSQPEQDTKQLLTKFTEARFKLESGVSYHDFQDIKQGLYVATKMYSENYPDGEFNGKFDNILTIYTDTASLWGLKISSPDIFLFGAGSICKGYIEKYPDVMAKYQEPGNKYLMGNVISGLYTKIADKTKELNQSIKDKYPQ